ncbi:DUF2157 domain-containing protein [Beggiatoa leptomitoformis]|uniref:DUF2157 domain-containing protein n=1 Tax=Beggiatoa leptomitoformis TaxID=288004 RepID=A0A2N9YJ43_9GAMM|nr:DUF2157 domain-containing protein [Beggiatoa leptomitoformis]ALG67538.2 DUF2157 domain-containing protein [Beggiatoa leptomitoformis]AUI70236.2 DUF2157 domain-containing protein [Beggiatoa leptomitoformis]
MMQVSQQDIQDAVKQGILDATQATSLWQFLTSRQTQPQFNMANIAYFLGAFLVLCAMTWFLSEAWQLFGSLGIIGIATVYALLFILLGSICWQKPQQRVAGGLLFTLAVCMTPLAVFGVQLLLEQQENISFLFPQRGIWMAIGTIIVGVITLKFVPFPFLTAPIAFACWFLSIELIPTIFGGEAAFSWQVERAITLYFGVIMLLGSYLVDRRTREDYAFWGYLFGMLAFWVSVTLILMDTEQELQRVLYLIVNLSLLILSVLLQRKVFVIFGALGILIYVGHLSYRVFADSMLFPFILTLIGLSVIFLGVQYQRYVTYFNEVIQQKLPRSLKYLLPQQRIRH